MNHRQSPHLDLEKLTSLAEGSVGSEPGAWALAHLLECRQCREATEEIRAIQRSLGVPPSGPTVDFTESIFQRIADRASERNPDLRGTPRNRWWSGWVPQFELERWGWSHIGVGAAAMLTLSALLFVPGKEASSLLPTNAPHASEWAAKSANQEADDAERWVRLDVYRAAASDTPPVAVDDFVRKDDALLFAYHNRGPDPFEYLAIFGFDSQGALYWYYPDTNREGADARAIPIRPDVAREELTEGVRHALPPGEFVLVGLFGREATRTADIEKHAHEWWKKWKAERDEQAQQETQAQGEHRPVQTKGIQTKRGPRFPVPASAQDVHVLRVEP